jgi:putative glutamine transport system permease protein
MGKRESFLRTKFCGDRTPVSGDLPAAFKIRAAVRKKGGAKMNVIFNHVNFIFLLRGLRITIIIAFSSIFFSFLFGSILGIARYHNKGLFAKIAGIYIDTVRNIPLLLFIIGCRFTMSFTPVVSAIIAMTIFTSAMIAEIVRGGL